jgi:hypothetical protein
MEAYMVETSRISHCLDNRLTDDGVVVSLTHRIPPPPKGKFRVLISVRGWVNPRTIVQLNGVGKLKKFCHFRATRTRDLRLCNIVRQPTTLTRAPYICHCPINESELFSDQFCATTRQMSYNCLLSYTLLTSLNGYVNFVCLPAQISILLFRISRPAGQKDSYDRSLVLLHRYVTGDTVFLHILQLIW